MSIFMQLFQRQIGGHTYPSRRRAKKNFNPVKLEKYCDTFIMCEYVIKMYFAIIFACT